jgi:hypothetical protein
VLKNKATFVGETIRNSNDILRIGKRRSGIEEVNAIIDEVAIYKQAIGVYQIQQLYSQGLPKHQLARQ